MRQPQPALIVIERELFQPSDALIQRWAAGEPLPSGLRATLATNPEAVARRADWERAVSQDAHEADHLDEALPVPPMPAKLQALIHRRVAARHAVFDPIPQPGQIVRIDHVRGPQGLLEELDLPRPLAVLLDAPTSLDAVWFGWLVTTETDYAGLDDVLLGPEDEPCDPLARMIQTGNRVRIYLPSASRVLAQLQPERLAAVRALASERATPRASTADSVPPGRVVARSVGSHTILTGPPLGDDHDPRHAYRQLYRRAAATFLEPPVRQVEAASLAPAQRPALLQHLIDLWRDWADHCGVALVPTTPLAQPMNAGRVPDVTEVYYTLDGKVRLHLRPSAHDVLLQVRVERLTDAVLQIEWYEAGECRLKDCLDATQPHIQLTIDPYQTSELIFRDAADHVLFRLPLGGFHDQ